MCKQHEGEEKVPVRGNSLFQTLQGKDHLDSRNRKLVCYEREIWRQRCQVTWYINPPIKEKCPKPGLGHKLFVRVIYNFQQGRNLAPLIKYLSHFLKNCG